LECAGDFDGKEVRPFVGDAGDGVQDGDGFSATGGEQGAEAQFSAVERVGAARGDFARVAGDAQVGERQRTVLERECGRGALKAVGAEVEVGLAEQTRQAAEDFEFGERFVGEMCGTGAVERVCQVGECAGAGEDDVE